MRTFVYLHIQARHSAQLCQPAAIHCAVHLHICSVREGCPCDSDSSVLYLFLPNF